MPSPSHDPIDRLNHSANSAMVLGAFGALISGAGLFGVVVQTFGDLGGGTSPSLNREVISILGVALLAFVSSCALFVTGVRMRRWQPAAFIVCLVILGLGLALMGVLLATIRYDVQVVVVWVVMIGSAIALVLQTMLNTYRSYRFVLSHRRSSGFEPILPAQPMERHK